MQGMRGSAQRYVKFLLASTAGYKEPMLHQTGCLHAPGPSPQPSGAHAAAARELHIHFMSHCEHHMLPFHGQVKPCWPLPTEGIPGVKLEVCLCASQNFAGSAVQGRHVQSAHVKCMRTCGQHLNARGLFAGCWLKHSSQPLGH